MSQGDEFNFGPQTNESGATGIQGKVDKIEINHNNASPPTIKEVFETLQAEVEGKPWSQDTPESIVDEFESPTEMLSVAYSTAEEEITSDVETKTTDQIAEESATWTDRFKAIVPLGIKLGTSVGKAVLNSYVQKSPVVAGLQALLTTLESADAE